MDLKREMRIIAFVLMLFVACTAEDELESGYIFTCPRSIRPGSDNQLQLLRFGCLDKDDSFKVKLYVKETYNGNETLVQEEVFHLENGKSDSLFNFFVNPFEGDYIYDGRVEMNGTICGKCVSGSDRVSFSNRQENIIIIQTDKPVYKPGQNVQFRVLKADKNLKPSDDNNDKAIVYVEDPQGTRLFEWKDVPLGNGMKQFEVPLSEEPVLGYWQIKVVNNNVTHTQSFEVKEYVLPKFEVKIEFPRWVLANAEKINIQICVKYTYGKPVIGKLKLNVSLEKYSYSRDKTPVLQETFKINGCLNFTLNVPLIEPDNVYKYRRIMVVANAIEEGTGVQINTTQYLQRQYLPLNLNFNTDNNYAQHYKPGLPYTGKLKVTNPDDSPAPGEGIQICATVSRERIICDNWLAKRKDRECKNYTSNEHGFITFTLPPQKTDSESVQLEAKSLRYAKDSQQSGSRLDSLNQPSAGISLNPYYSPSGSFIQMENVGTPIPCGTQKRIRLLFTSKEDTEFDLQYKIIRQGSVVQAGIKTVNCNAEDDDVSEKFDNDDELINGSKTQIVPAPQSKTSNGNCHCAKEVDYVPPIGETYITVDADSSLSPSIILLVFYTREDREVVADTQKIAIEQCFKNEVEFEFGDEEKQPGTKTSIKVTSSPNSLCGLKVVDKSVSLLNSNDQLTKEKIFQYIESLDTGIYYSTDPCNQKIPQPGLYSTKEASILLPRPPYISSSYEDSYGSFQAAGFVVISNLRLFTRPCYPGGGYGGGFQAESFSANGGIQYDKHMKGHAVALASTARRPAAPQAADAKIGVSAVNTKSAVDVRDYFPETWLFELESTGPDGVYVAKETLPHTITEWVGSAVCINSEDGLGLSNTATIRGFQAFFISYTLPISVIRGEEFVVVVSIYNYVDAALPITVSVDESDQFELMSDSINHDVCIHPDTSENLRIKLKASALGPVNFTVRAETAASSVVCRGETVYDGLAKDAITQPIECEAEGYPTETFESVLFCPTDEEDDTYTGSLKLILPEDVVEDSARAVVDITGNVMGPAIQNLDSLVALPTGCGEQNMVKFTPNYLVLDYLNFIDQLTDKTKRQATKNLNTGYQRELTYRHDDGSFSAFGKTDKEGSMFLTAFVLRSFWGAKKYITIDPSIITSAQQWIASKQQPDGCVPNVGQIIDHGLQGGIEKEKNTGAITAYAMAALIISGYENETVIEKGMSCLSEYKASKPYDNCLCAYTEALAGKTEAARKRLDEVRASGNKTEGVEYFRNPNGTKSLNLETAAYFILADLELGGTASSVLGPVRYLTKNLNPRGGFYSTQDTCVGLNALSKFAGMVYKDPSDLQVTCSGSLDETKEITEDNRLLVQRSLVYDVPGEIKFEATGSGCGLIQAVLRYNTKTPPKVKSFYLEMVGRCISSDCKKKQITTTTSYIPEGKASGMSVVEIKMVTGTVPVKASLDKLKNDKNSPILRVDVENNSVICYLKQITNIPYIFAIDVEVVVDVDNPQPGLGKVYDYYATENSASTSYSFGHSNMSESLPDPEVTER